MNARIWGIIGGITLVLALLSPLVLGSAQKVGRLFESAETLYERSDYEGATDFVHCRKRENDPPTRLYQEVEKDTTKGFTFGSKTKRPIKKWECVIMNKYHGITFEEYLKEKGTFEEIPVLAQKRWEELQTEEPEPPSEITEDLPRGINRFFQWLRHAINNLLS